MRYLTLFVLFIILSACGKKSTTTTPGTSSTTVALNSTESQMVGTWKLKKERFKGTPYSTFDTTYTVFPNSPYIIFKTDTYTGQPVTGGSLPTGSKLCTDNLYLYFDPYNASPHGQARGNSLKDIYWLYDSVGNKVVCGAMNWTLVEITSSKLTLSLYKSPTMVDTLFLEK